MYNRIVISSGHSKFVRGASDELDEVTEARRVVEHLADELIGRGIDVVTYHDDVSKAQQENLQRIVDAHNREVRDLDVSIHFNAYVETDEPRGVEVLYVTQSALAAEVSRAIANAGDFINRGAKKRTDLYFLNQTAMPSILIETCFVDSTSDAENYRTNFDLICEAIADVLGGGVIEKPPPSEEASVVTGTCSSFGGPDDTGVSPSEGLAFIYDITPENQWLFLPIAPANCSGLARRLNTRVHYCAMRWDYSVHPKETLLQKTVLVRNPKTGVALTCTPADWGPHEEKTGRLIDLSPSMMTDLGLETDDVVEVTFPYTEDVA
jgi:N-acetylmuramoyl-L-alanine amidase